MPHKFHLYLILFYFFSSLLVQHLGLNACKALSTKNALSSEVQNKNKEKPNDDVTMMFEILKLYLDNSTNDQPAIFSVVSVLRLLISQSPVNKHSNEMYRNIDDEIWKLLTSKKSLTASIISQSLLTLVETFYKLNLTGEQQRSALNAMFTETCPASVKVELRELILAKEIQRLEQENSESFRLDFLVVNVLRSLANEGKELILTAEQDSNQDLEQKCFKLPNQSVSLKYISTLLRKLSGKLLSTLEEKDDVLVLNFWNEFSSNIFEQANLILKLISEVVKNLETKFKSDDEEMKIKMKYLKQASRSTVLGSLLPTLINIQTHILNDSLFKGSLKTLTSIVALTCELAAKFGGEESTISLQLSAVSPWTSATQVETSHPVKDGFKMSEVIQIPGKLQFLI